MHEYKYANEHKTRQQSLLRYFGVGLWVFTWRPARIRHPPKKRKKKICRDFIRECTFTVEAILWISMTSTSFIFTELANSVKLNDPDLLCFHRAG